MFRPHNQRLNATYSLGKAGGGAETGRGQRGEKDPRKTPTGKAAEETDARGTTTGRKGTRPKAAKAPDQRPQRHPTTATKALDDGPEDTKRWKGRTPATAAAKQRRHQTPSTKNDEGTDPRPATAEAPSQAPPPQQHLCEHHVTEHRTP